MLFLGTARRILSQTVTFSQNVQLVRYAKRRPISRTDWNAVPLGHLKVIGSGAPGEPSSLTLLTGNTGYVAESVVRLIAR